jgi:hypothetical protein
MDDTDGQLVLLGVERDAQGIRFLDRDVSHIFVEIAALRWLERDESEY